MRRESGREWGRGRNTRDEWQRRFRRYDAAAPANRGRKAGGWEGRRGERRQGGGDSSISFFFTNFPDNYMVLDMWAVFQQWTGSRVNDVYIPEKRDRKLRRFGFVHFRDVQDVQDMLKRLGTITIGSMKLHVNLPRYDKEGRRVDNQPQGENHQSQGEAPPDGPANERGGPSNPPGSYAEALRDGRYGEAGQRRGRQKEQWKIASVEVEAPVEEWLA